MSIFHNRLLQCAPPPSPLQSEIVLKREKTKSLLRRSQERQPEKKILHTGAVSRGGVIKRGVSMSVVRRLHYISHSLRTGIHDPSNKINCLKVDVLVLNSNIVVTLMFKTLKLTKIYFF